MVKEKLCICLPGESWSYLWLASFCDLTARLNDRFQVIFIFSQGCNLFDVRNGFITHLKTFKPDYVLWIDGDNQVSFEGFTKLYDYLITHDDCHSIGAWYLMNTMFKSNLVAGGWKNNTRPDPFQLNSLPDPFEVDYIGFGFLLMRMSVLDAFERPDVFRPLYDEEKQGFHGDDVSFCYDALDKGFRFYLHPQVHSPHLKLMPIPMVRMNPAKEEEVKEVELESVSV